MAEEELKELEEVVPREVLEVLRTLPEEEKIRVWEAYRLLSEREITDYLKYVGKGIYRVVEGKYVLRRVGPRKYF